MTEPSTLPWPTAGGVTSRRLNSADPVVPMVVVGLAKLPE